MNYLSCTCMCSNCFVPQEAIRLFPLKPKELSDLRPNTTICHGTPQNIAMHVYIYAGHAIGVIYESSGSA